MTNNAKSVIGVTLEELASLYEQWDRPPDPSRLVPEKELAALIRKHQRKELL